MNCANVIPNVVGSAGKQTLRGVYAERGEAPVMAVSIIFRTFAKSFLMTKTIYYKDRPIALDKTGFESLRNVLKTIRAGGGLVKNAKNEYLLIFRNGYWDLPKGKPNSGESIETCALREVQEETGISNLTIVREMPETYHLYTDSDGEIILKKCCWFEMKTADEQSLTPQFEEGISEAVWLSKEAVETKRSKMYATIQQCLDWYFSNTTPNV